MQNYFSWLNSRYSVAEDEGTSEGAKKGWEKRRKLHGGNFYDEDNEIIDNGMIGLGDEDHDTEHRGRTNSGITNYAMASKRFPISIRDSFLKFAREYGGDVEDVRTPEDLDKSGYIVRPGRRKGELRLMKKVKPTYANHFNAASDLEYSWRPKHVQRASPGQSKNKTSFPRVRYLDMSGTGQIGNNFERHYEARKE